MKKILLLFLLTLSSLGIGQNTVGTIQISENAYDAYTLFTVNTKAYLINNCGELINEWTSEYLPGVAVYLLPNGNLLRAGRLDDGSSNIGFGGQGGIIELFNWEGDKIWQYVYSTMEYKQHHDVYPMPNGNVLILAVTVVDGADAIQAGRDPNLLSETDLFNQRVFEVQPEGSEGGTVVWEWNVMDHIVQDFDPTKDNFGDVANSPGKVDINYLNDNEPGRNWLHFNSMQYNEELDQIVLSTRNLCELWIIDHSTTTEEAASSSGGIYGKGGDLLYRWGNPAAYRQGTQADQKLFGPHTPYIIPSGLPNAGKIMVFNNGFRRTPLYSQVDIITPPASSPGFYVYNQGTAYGPETTDFTYPEVPPTEDSDFFSAITSNGQQLPNGNILICEGREAIFFEIDENNDIVWEYVSPISNANGAAYEQGGPPPINSFAFRATKYSKDYPAFDNVDIVPGPPLELNPDIAFCQSLSVSDLNRDEFRLFPNPTSDKITIDATFVPDEILVYDLNGKTLLTAKNQSQLSLSSLSNGLYFVEIRNGIKNYRQKIVVNK